MPNPAAATRPNCIHHERVAFRSPRVSLGDLVGVLRKGVRLPLVVDPQQPSTLYAGANAYDAPKDSGIDTVLIPKENEKDLAEIPDNVKRGLKIIPVGTVDELLSQALSAPLTPMAWP